VQGVRPGPRGQRPHDGIGQLLDHRIEQVRTFEALGDGRWPRRQGGLAPFAGPPGGAEEGLPHLLCLPARRVRVA
jgi:hypothetical protein